MADGALPYDAEDGDSRRWLVPAIAAVLLLALAYFIFQALTDVRGVAVPAAPQTVIDMLPPPPPPPPPPPEPTPEKPPEPTDAPTPAPTPAPAPEAPAPMQIDSAAQAGADSFGLQAGSGAGAGAPGSTGTCLGPNCGKAASGGISDAFYARYLSGALQEKIQGEGRVNRFVFSADFSITISPAGRVSDATLLRSSGDRRRDEILLAVLQAVAGLDAPPASIRFPQKITVRGRRSL